jgi:opacity protein-like surface antigen
MAEDFKNIDQIIRQKFENFEPEPPIQVWEKIQSGIKKTPPSSPGILLPLIVSISLMLFIGGLFYHHYSTKNETSLDSGLNGMTINTASLGSTGSTTITDNSLQESFYQTPSEIPQAAAASDEPVVSSIPVRVPYEKKDATDKKKKKNNQVTTSSPVSAPVRTPGWKPGLVQALKSGELTYNEAMNYGLSARDYRKLSTYREDSKAKIAEWSVGLYFNPEATSSQDENIDNTISYNLSLLPQVSFNNFFIQSGVNMRFTHDKGNMAVDYNRYLGSYEDVYDITFDTINNEIIPTFYTNTVDVWDTITHYSVSDTKAAYTYLEVPVLFGYRYSFGKVSLFAKAGPSASFIVFKNIPEAVAPEDNAQIINVNYPVPARNTINWQMMMGAGMDYKLSSRISFSLEPTFRFALSPEYDVPSDINGKTKSFGVRAGLNYKF